MNRKFLGSLAMGLVLMFCASAIVMAKSESASNGSYTAKDKEYYKTEAELAFILPGLVFTLVDFDIPADLQPVVEFTLQNENGMPLDLYGVYTLGPIDVRFMLDYIPVGEEQKINYSGPGGRDRGGVYTTIDIGHYTYKFATVLPADYEMDATHTLASVATRDLRDFDLDRYYDNDVYNFVPSAASAPMPRDIVTTATCNRCHDPLGEHGGRYQEVQVCQQCHNPSLDEDGVSYSFDVLIHRVHSGNQEGVEMNYPAILNDCQVCHTGGIPTADYPLVASPNPAPVCEGSASATTTLSWMADGRVDIHLNSADGPMFSSNSSDGSKQTGRWVKDGMKFFLVDTASGDVLDEVTVDTTVFGCANNPPGTFRGEAGVLHTNWTNHPSRAVCGACHVDVDFATGEGHSEDNIVQEDDTKCGMCHKPDTGVEYDKSVVGAHTVDYKSNQLPGVLVDIISVEDTAPGEKPIVTFSLRDKFGNINPNTLNRLLFTITGPNEDFDFYVQESVVGNLLQSGTNWKYAFSAALPADAEGSYSLGVEGRASATINPGEDNEFTMNDQSQNFIYPFAVTDESAMPRRMVVDDAKCENCHSNLSLHGGNRHDASGYCSSCHRWDATDEEVRLSGEPEGIHFNYMVHKIHRGAELDRGYVVYGYRNSVNDFSDIEFPGDLRNCESCHVDDSYKLPVPDYALDTVAPADYWSPLQPAAAACMSCHDDLDTAAHVDANISALLGESCTTCHGDGAAFSVEEVHAR